MTPATETTRSPVGEVLLDIQDLRKYYPQRRGLLQATKGHVRAVDGVSFTIRRGETLGLVGESGCGKSTTGRAILHLTKPTGGRVVYDGKSVGDLDRLHLRELRRRAQIVFQDPFGTLNPRLTVGSMPREVLRVHGLGGEGASRERRVHGLLELVGLLPEHVDRYPHEFSGGQRQRIGIA